MLKILTCFSNISCVNVNTIFKYVGYTIEYGDNNMEIINTHALPDIVPKNFIRNSWPLDMRYQYEIMTAAHTEQVIEVFTQSFCRAEPMTHYLQMDEEKYRTFALAVTKKAIEDNLSVVALDKGKVIALVIVEDIAQPGPIPDFDPKFEYILALLESLGAEFFNVKKISTHSIAHLFITAVADGYRGQHLSTQINLHAMDLAADRGFEFVYCEFTHYLNEKGIIPHLRNWKQLIGAVTYNEFEVNGFKPFSNLSGGAKSYLWEIHENAQLRL